MSSLFRHVMRSKRKRNKSRSTAPVNTSGVISKASSCDHYETEKKQQQQQILRVSRTTSDEDDERRQSVHDQYPSRRRSRKPKHGTEHASNTGSITPDTVASGRYTPNRSSSHHDRMQSMQENHSRRSRSCRGFDEAPHHSPDKDIHDDIVSKRFSYSTNAAPNDFGGNQRFFYSSRPESKDGAERNTNTDSNTPNTVVSNGYTPIKPVSRRIHRVDSNNNPPSWKEDDPSPLKPKPVKLRFKQKDSNDHHQTTTNLPFPASKGHIALRMGKRSSGNTKTVIMNGDIVVSKSYNSKSSSDTATIPSSASSKSKAKAVRRESERNARAASALDDKGNDLFEKGYFDRAMACYTKALKLKRRTFAHILEETDVLEEELVLRDDSGNLADPHALVSMATSINNIGYLRQRSGDATPEETMAAYKKSLRIKRRILGNDSLSVGKTLNNIGSVHYLKRDFERALQAYDEALEIMKANLGEKHPDVATVMSNIGDVYLAQHNNETSIKYYRLALVIRWEAFGEKSPRVVRLLEKISNLEIGDMSSKMANQKTQSSWGDDAASDAMVGSDFQPVSEALKLLQEQVRNDIDQVDRLERAAAIETLKDKIIIIRGMRDVWNGSGPELLDNDSTSVQTAMSRLSGR